MNGGLTYAGEQAKAVVQEKYPSAKQYGIDGESACIGVVGKLWENMRVKAISGYCKTFSAAWISAARRIEKGKQK